MPVDLGELVQRVVTDVQSTLTQHTITVNTPEVLLILYGDALRLEHVLQNPIQNAIKYSPSGGLVTVAIALREEMAYVSITDEGIGIPQSSMSRLFERFYRAEQKETNGISGLGIGLYVVKEIVSLHGGTITVTSAEGIGSTFTICLPLVHETVDDIVD